MIEKVIVHTRRLSNIHMTAMLSEFTCLLKKSELQVWEGQDNFNTIISFD